MDMQLINVLLPAALSVAFMISWEHTNLPCHVFHLLKKVGFSANWSHKGEELKDREAWFLWVISQHPNSLLVELITCPICLSWHTGFWFGLPFLIGGVVTPMEFLLSIPLGVITRYKIG